MKFVGLTGGIGCGKSTVAAGLARRGAVVIDVDQLSRDIQQPGNLLFDQIVARWGAGVLDADGRLDRAALGQIVFADREQLGELTLMSAPAIENELVARASVHLGTDAVVLCEAALYLRPTYGLTALVMVDAPVETAVARLVRDRGMTEADALARISSQLPRELRLANADRVIDNSGDLGALESQLDELWTWCTTQPDGVPRLNGS